MDLNFLSDFSLMIILLFLVLILTFIMIHKNRVSILYLKWSSIVPKGCLSKQTIQIRMRPRCLLKKLFTVKIIIF